ncbi:MAG: SIS domain-containing protein, partial [Candidatus Sumerlaeia bacterium]|nr:SIS domain-containing protein [Candidatus Sumerlaeia bacterium]
QVLSSAQAEELYSQLKTTGRWIKDILFSQSEKIANFAKTVTVKQVWHFLGSGPNSATAEYGAIKLLESSALPAIWYDIEEWAHTGYFLTESANPLILIAPRGKSYKRLMELLPAIKYLKVDLLLITSENTSQLDIDEERIIQVPHLGLAEPLTPLLFCVPLQLLALNLAERLQTIPFHLEDQERLELNSQQIYQSQQITSLSDILPDSDLKNTQDRWS